ncbi:hypothetical protein BO79DRAFT_223220 [Aspergillus costaricaensis CBS 115574]|uniref:Uncharacterized protein n=1 Tax=Aspergillus costaricaensis CBS 115574 TaxID=1448317 RepID=A0ACD1IVN5_9EURO|nr:hypothetical protein BO79DRAFT_223220 [Aspergillus costaricaensis CBS 115574]RAK94136.1 hypothetical protein BO79DRAFT_223220 [Aspergillus costaricaensis CBS 115574]
MNWTGGRLRRHSSNNTGNRKQNFKRSRIAETKGPLTTSINKNICLEGIQAGEPCSKPMHHPSQQVEIKSSHNSSLFYPAKKPRLVSTVQESSQAAQDLQRIKHKLLEKADWASVAAARPLTVLFPPVEALQKFGRRRKITNDDRERLGSSVLRPKLTYGPKHRRGAESEESIQDLDIRINGQPVGASYPGFHGPPTDATSQSMLLDQESPPTTPKPLVHKYVCENVGVRSSVGDRSWILDSSSILPLSVSSSDRRLSTLGNSIVRGSDYFVDNSTGKEQFQVTGSEPLQSADTSPKVQEVGTPIRRRFTIDDQILAEEEWMKAAYGTSLERDGYSTAHKFSQSLLNPELSSPTANDSRRQISEQESMSTSSTLNHSSYGWLPEPRHNIQRFISQRTDKGQIDKVPSESRLCGTRLAPLSRKPTTSPLIIFGQSVDLDGVLFAKQREHEIQQAQHDFTCSATTFREANSYISTDNYPFGTNLRRPDNFTFSPNTVKLSKPTVTPRAARIYIDQACATLSGTAGPERVFSWRHPEDRPAQERTNRRSLYN